MTPSKGKGRPKKKGFKGTPKKINLDVHENEQIPVSTRTEQNSPRHVANIDQPIGLVNIRNDCFFNSVVQALLDPHTGPMNPAPSVRQSVSPSVCDAKFSYFPS